jgi:hypothetical protein
MRMDISIKSITCTDLENLSIGLIGRGKTIFDEKMTIDIKEQHLGNISTITNINVLELEGTGERCKIICTTVFDLQTDWNVIRQIISDRTLELYAELSFIGQSHARAFFLEKAKDTPFKNLVFPYHSLPEITKTLQPLLLANRR